MEAGFLALVACGLLQVLTGGKDSHFLLLLALDEDLLFSALVQEGGRGGGGGGGGVIDSTTVVGVSCIRPVMKGIPVL